MNLTRFFCTYSLRNTVLAVTAGLVCFGACVRSGGLMAVAFGGAALLCMASASWIGTSDAGRD